MQKLIIKRVNLTVILTALFQMSGATAAEINMRPGLWEIRTSSDLLLLAPHIPEDQMQNIKDLAKDYGVDMPEIESGAAISKTCITQEMANQKTMPQFYQNETGCVSKKASRNGNNYQVDFSCNGADLQGKGTASGQLTSAVSFVGQTRFIGTAQGNAVNEKADISGKWLDASCGQVKPM